MKMHYKPGNGFRRFRRRVRVRATVYVHLLTPHPIFRLSDKGPKYYEVHLTLLFIIMDI